MGEIIDGKLLSLKIKDQLKDKILKFNNDYKRDVCLAVVLVGDDPASQVYVRNKIKACEYVGIKSLSFYLPNDSTQKQVEDCVISLAKDKAVDGILVQLPLPKHLDENKILDLIPTNKDVDGFKAENIGRLAMGLDCSVACTPSGVIEMLKSINYDMVGKNAVVIGRSNIVGKPMSLLLLKNNCTVTICHSKTSDIKSVCKNADILVSAIGKPKFVTKDFVKNGAIVIDVGINKTENGLVGDVDFENVKDIASYISPVPGGVGPMTICMLLVNTYNLAVRREN